jgi:hypothetical protein
MIVVPDPSNGAYTASPALLLFNMGRSIVVAEPAAEDGLTHLVLDDIELPVDSRSLETPLVRIKTIAYDVPRILGSTGESRFVHRYLGGGQ